MAKTLTHIWWLSCFRPFLVVANLAHALGYAFIVRLVWQMVKGFIGQCVWNITGYRGQIVDKYARLEAWL